MDNKLINLSILFCTLGILLAFNEQTDFLLLQIIMLLTLNFAVKLYEIKEKELMNKANQ